MNLHQTSGDDDYKTKRFDCIVKLEQGDVPLLTPYKDSAKWVTIGIGFNLSDPTIRAKVLTKLGFSDVGLVAELGAYLSKPRDEPVNQVQSDLNTIVQRYLPGKSFAFASTEPVLELYNGTPTDPGIAKIYEDRVDTWTRSNGVASIAQSKERIALVSLSYNGVLGPKLATAIKDDDRAEAWYEIRYGSNAVGMEHALGTPMSAVHLEKYTAGEDRGLARRRDFEAALFGLYFNPAAPTEKEARDALGMLTKHRLEILEYENSYGTSRAGTAGDREDQVAAAVTAYSSLASMATAQTLIAALQPGKDWLLASLRSSYSRFTSRLTDANFLATNIYLASAGAAARFDSAAFETGTLAASNKNDLMVGDSKDDDLRGNAGADVLIGGDGNDRLEGGSGADELIGGNGRDVYVVNAESATKRVIDSDRLGTVFVRYTANGLQSEVSLSGTYRSTPAGTWASEDGTVTLSNSAGIYRAVVNRGGFGTVVEFGPDFNPALPGGDLGIRVEASPPSFQKVSTGTAAIDILVGSYVDGYPGSPVVVPPGEHAFRPRTEAVTDDKLVGGLGNDEIQGYMGNDRLEGNDGNDLLAPGLGNDVVVGGAGNDVVLPDEVTNSNAGYQWLNTSLPPVADAGNYAYVGFTFELAGAGNVWLLQANSNYLPPTSAGMFYPVPITGSEPCDDVIDVGAGADMVFAGWGRDTIWLGDGNDVAFGQGGADSIHGDGGDDLIYGDGDLAFQDAPHYTVSFADASLHGDDVIDGGDGNDTIYGGGGSDVIFGGADDDVISADGQQFADNALNIPIALQGDDYVDGGQGNDTLFGFAGADTLLGGEGADYLYGDHATLDAAYHGADYLDGGDGDDHLYGQGGSDTLIGGAGANVLVGGDGQDTLIATGTNDVLDGGTGADLLEVTDGASAEIAATLMAGADADTLVLEGSMTSDAVSVAINTTYSATSQNATLTFAGSNTVIRLSSGAEGSVIGRSLQSVAFADGVSWTTAELQEHLHGIATDGNDSLYAFNGESASLSGLGGNDSMYGGNGGDTLYGGDGNDTLYGQDGNDTLDGGAGSDEMFGAEGADKYFGGGGNDAMRDYSTASDDEFHHELGDGYDIVEDKGGTDRLVFGAGIAASNTIVRVTEGGTLSLNVDAQNTVSIGAMFSQTTGALVADRAVETVVFADGTTWNVSKLMSEALRTTAAADEIYAFDTNDVVDGGDGNDSLHGFDGNDTLIGGNGDDILTGDAGADVLSGGANSDSLLGGDGNDRLDGGVGNDYLTGAAGDDVFVFGIGYGADVVDEQYSGGLDRIEFGVGITTSGFSSIRNINGDLTLVLTSGDKVTVRAMFDGYGALGSSNVVESMRFVDGTVWDAATLKAEALRQALIATSGNDLSYLSDAADTMDGGDGNDKLYGLGGADTLIGSNGADTLVGGFGNDNLQGGIGNDVLQGEDDDDSLSGGDGADKLDGGYGNDRLDGGVGADSMVDGAGNDTYVVDNVGDTITESATSTVDTVESSIAWTLGQNLENLTLTGTSSISGSGNALANTLIGNSGANYLYGGGGADTMIGGLGDDSYLVDDIGDSVSESANAGTDTVQSSITWTLGANFENLTLAGSSAINGTGNGLSNTLYGNFGDNVLNGGAGADSLIGDAGNDTYVVDNAADVVTELAGEGVDLVKASLTWVLGAELENLTLTGSSASNGTGNALDNVLTGNGADNTLTGGAGNDTLNAGLGINTMLGGTGDDTYVVNVATDIVTELAGEGTDKVKSAVTWTLGSNLENLTLTGSLAINATGNTLANVLIGNSAANALSGGEGNDIYDGAAGADTFIDTSLTSKDTYRWGIGSGLDRLTDAGGSLDHVDLFAGVAKSDLRFARNGNDLELTIAGQADRLAIGDWFVSSANQIEEFRLSDGSKVLASEVQSLLGAMAAFSARPGGTGDWRHEADWHSRQWSNLAMPAYR